MTHTLHRSGRARGLRDDWVALAMSARGINRRGSAPALRRFLEVALRHGAVNAGDIRTGSLATLGRGRLLSRVTEDSIVHAVFARRKDAAAFVRGFAAEGLGVSVVLSGLFRGVGRCLRESGLEPHTLSFSLGTWGRRAPAAGAVEELTTMCGHGLVGAPLARACLRDAAAGRITAAEAAARLARPCVCGVFNPVRARRILEAAARGRDGGEPSSRDRRRPSRRPATGSPPGAGSSRSAS